MPLRINIISLLCLPYMLSYGQISNPPTPTFKQFKPIELNGNKSYQQNFPKPPSNRAKLGATADDIIRQQNLQAQRLMLQKQQQNRQKESLKIVQDLLAEEKRERTQKNNQVKATEVEENLYLSAGRNLYAMLLEKEQYSLKKAVWLAEYPYLRRQLSYDRYNANLAKIVDFCKAYAQENALDWAKHDDRAKALVDYFSKTISLKNGQVHKRIMYDFNDAYGRQSYRPLMVSKLMETNKGQCHSMPLLFKIMADEINVNAYICLSPAHSFIKIFLDSGHSPVFETTNGYLTDEKWILSTNIVPFTALRNGVYLDTLSQKENLVHCLNHLANAYESEFGYQTFVKEIAEIAITHAPKYPPAWALFSNYVTYSTMAALKELGYPKLEELDSYPAIKGRLDMMYRIYADMDRMGYKDLQESEYTQWLHENQAAIKQYQLQDF